MRPIERVSPVIEPNLGGGCCANKTGRFGLTQLSWNARDGEMLE